MAFFGVLTYFTNDVQNPVTGERQRLKLSPRQEVVLGLLPDKTAEQHGGLYPSQSLQQYLDQ